MTASSFTGGEAPSDEDPKGPPAPLARPGRLLDETDVEQAAGQAPSGRGPWFVEPTTG